ncbi:hypothetical protein CSV72_15350 [Sporosarcina sp. P20a]|nr:hypothetical protein CSV72_15350 [Sporosarcina sp. P20a]
MRQLAAPPPADSWLEAIPHVPARVQKVNTHYFQSPTTNRAMSQPKVTKTGNRIVFPSTAFVGWVRYAIIILRTTTKLNTTQQRRHNCGVGRGRETTGSTTASWLLAGGNPPSACAGPESRHLLTSVPNNQSSNALNKKNQDP